MNPIENFSGALHVFLAFGLLWVLVFILARDYRIDVLRDRLFKIREELFDYAARGGVSFNDPAYGRLRKLINSLIRFAHRLTFTRFLVGGLFIASRDHLYDKEPLVEWRKAVEALPPESQYELKRIHAAAVVLVVRHLVTGSPIMLLLLALFSVRALLNGLAERLRLLETFADELPGLDTLQAQAMESDAAERHPEEVYANQ